MTAITDIAFAIDRAAGTPVYAQLYEAIRRRIVSGDIATDALLPPTRSLALDLGLSRSTVNAAYDQLVAEGYVAGRRGAGYFVRPMGEADLAPEAAPAPPRPSGPPPRPRPKPLSPGVPDMRLFPYAQWARQMARTARATPEALIDQPSPFGDWALRTAIADHLAEWRGIEASPDQIVVTAGSGDALEICIRTLAAPGDRVALEDPGYPVLRAFVESLGLAPAWLDIDSEGARPPDAPAAMAVLTPSQQFPLGGAMSPARRAAFLAWAEAGEAWLIEDDYDSEFRYAGRPIPAMASLDRADRTIYVGSFSKVFSNSLRLGYLVAPERLVSPVRATLARFGTKASIAPQRPLADFMASGAFYRHVRRVRRLYNERRKALSEACLAAFPAEIRLQDNRAGMLAALTLPASVDDAALATEAAALGPLALSSFSARPANRRGLILGFCAATPEEIAEAVERLAEIVRPKL